ncbi:hypothetical protein BDU57DRAFT_508927 [Ampelomyces quisqualis]|uniref:Uncharacterized protein n=1 Tax=Ampelomyces quisqualis TaxID=50730 RepID=A0A6A5R3A0_AMPQU|nr:hypothetical protein BDU57DRAFT_508927 [Ampelomyces quisqualis]
MHFHLDQTNTTHARPVTPPPKLPSKAPNRSPTRLPNRPTCAQNLDMRYRCVRKIEKKTWSTHRLGLPPRLRHVSSSSSCYPPRPAEMHTPLPKTFGEISERI